VSYRVDDLEGGASDGTYRVLNPPGRAIAALDHIGNGAHGGKRHAPVQTSVHVGRALHAFDLWMSARSYERDRRVVAVHGVDRNRIDARKRIKSSIARRRGVDGPRGVKFQVRIAQRG
jgi:hypothetical protein